MRRHEVVCFANALRCDPEQIKVVDLMTNPPGSADLARVDVVLLGGSGDYSVARGGPWLAAALDAMVGLYETSKPTFASCWGFQAMARALGGEVVTDHARAEVGVTWLTLTEAGRNDPVFGPLLMAGLGGVHVEVTKDVAFRIHPITDSDVDDMIGSLRGARLLGEFRGRAPLCTDAYREALLRLSQLVGDFHTICEIDVNPFMVGTERADCVAVDGRIRIRLEA